MQLLVVFARPNVVALYTNLTALTLCINSVTLAVTNPQPQLELPAERCDLSFIPVKFEFTVENSFHETICLYGLLYSKFCCTPECIC